MTTAIRFPALRRAPRHERRPRVIANRRARASLSREKRWKRRGSSGVTRKVLALVAALCLAGGAWFVYDVNRASRAAPILFPDFVAQAEATFPESLNGHTRARGGTLSDGQEVPVGLTILLPARALASASASPDALTRLAAPFVGNESTITGEEIGERIAQLAAAALPEGVSSCYTYKMDTARHVAVSDSRTLHVAPLEISFNPEC